ncbi:LOW QUALITY PROTEIN: hypothetical protein ACHAW6_012455, partial [Cyclotella cf. meneghiniana]
MYGLPQAGIIAQELLEKHIRAMGYHQSKINPGLWKHNWQPISFALYVNDFGIKYGKHTLTIYSKHSRSTMKYPATGMAHVTSGSPYHGTTATALSTSPCQATVKKPVSVSTTPNQPNHKTNLTPVHHKHM